jgi:ribonuclease HII
MDIVGVDEVGRGAWAGPVCVAAVRLNVPVQGLRDSKLLSAAQRQRLALDIRRFATVGVGWASADEIDTVGLNKALGLAMERALRPFEPDALVLLDGSVNYLPSRRNVRLMIKADITQPAVSAASIVAKVARDNLMAVMAGRYPAYGFERHVGYGTAFHRDMIALLGPSLFHRHSFTPIAHGSML